MERRTAVHSSALLRASRAGDWDTVPGLEAAWCALQERCPSASVFQTLQWHRAWWRAFGAPHELCLLLVHSGPELVGVAPLMIRNSPTRLGRQRRSLHFIGSVNHASDYCDVLVDPTYPEALDALLGTIARLPCDRVDLSHLRSDSPHLGRIAEGLEREGFRVSNDVQDEAPVRLLGDRDADLRAANKKSLKRNRNHFRRLGDLRLWRCTDPEQALDYLDVLFELHRRRWAGTDSPSQFRDPQQRSFYRDIVRTMLPPGWLALDVLMLDDDVLACHVGFEYRGTFIWYKPAFDPRHAGKSPGQVLLKYLLDNAIDRRQREFDFTVGSEGFKYRFANDLRRIHRLVGYRSVTAFWQHRSRERIKKRLR